MSKTLSLGWVVLATLSAVPGCAGSVGGQQFKDQVSAFLRDSASAESSTQEAPAGISLGSEQDQLLTGTDEQRRLATVRVVVSRVVLVENRTGGMVAVLYFDPGTITKEEGLSGHRWKYTPAALDSERSAQLSTGQTKGVRL